MASKVKKTELVLKKFKKYKLLRKVFYEDKEKNNKIVGIYCAPFAQHEDIICSIKAYIQKTYISMVEKSNDS